MIRNKNGITNEIINNVYKFYTTAIFSRVRYENLFKKK